MSGVTVTGPDVDRKLASPALGLSYAITVANVATRAGIEATFYVRDAATGERVAHTESDGLGCVLIYGKAATR